MVSTKIGHSLPNVLTAVQKVVGHCLKSVLPLEMSHDQFKGSPAKIFLQPPLYACCSDQIIGKVAYCTAFDHSAGSLQSQGTVPLRNADSEEASRC
jgi:hypothetical protein